MSNRGPQRRVSDHFHPESWTEADQHRFEDRLAKQLEDMNREVRVASTRILLMMGAIGLLVFVIPIIAPFIRLFILGSASGQ